MPARSPYIGWTTYVYTPPRQSTEYNSELFERYQREMERGIEAIRSRPVDIEPAQVYWEYEMVVSASPRGESKIRKVTPLSTLAEKERELCQE